MNKNTKWAYATLDDLEFINNVVRHARNCLSGNFITCNTCPYGQLKPDGKECVIDLVKDLDKVIHITR